MSFGPLAVGSNLIAQQYPFNAIFLVSDPAQKWRLALNFLLHQTLGGGGTVSLKNDAQGKTLSSAMLRMEIDVTEPLTL